jgi:hypothetical protein
VNADIEENIEEGFKIVTRHVHGIKIEQEFEYHKGCGTLWIELKT